MASGLGSRADDASRAPARLVRVLGEARGLEDEVDSLPADDVPTLALCPRAPEGTGTVSRPSAAPLIEGAVVRASARMPAVVPDAAPVWGLDMLAGRLVELSGGRASALLTVAFGLVLDAQRRDEPAAWIAARGSFFYPPDAAANGIDLDTLVVVRPPDAVHVPRAADLLARSAAFGLLVLDLGAGFRVPVAVQARLLNQAQQHALAIVCLTESSSSSLGSLVSLRAEVDRTRRAPGVFACRLRATKDKHRVPGWEHVEMCRGPAGVR